MTPTIIARKRTGKVRASGVRAQTELRRHTETCGAVMQHYEFHPVAEQYPLMPEAELSHLVADMQANGYDRRYPGYLLNGLLLDGRNRYHAAQQAGVEMIFHELPADTDPEEFARRANEHRRHLTEAWITQRRKERIARITTARQEGKSERSIAESERVSKSQVRRDLQESSTGPSPGPVEPRGGKVTGKDGRTRTAKPKQASLCERCQRAGAVNDCKTCKELREAKKTTKKTKKTPARESVKDKTGAEVPDRLRDAFADPSLSNLIGELESLESMLKPESLTTRAGKLCAHYPFVLIEKVKEHTWEALHQVQLALSALRSGLPYAVCPKCSGVESSGNGKTCKTCRGCGHVPEFRWNELQAEKQRA